MSSLSDEELELIRVRLLDKVSVASIAKELRRAPSVIKGAVNELATRQALGLKDYDKEQRLVLLNKAFEKAEWLIGSVTDEVRFEKLVNALRTLMEMRQAFDAGRDLPDDRNLSLNIVLNRGNVVDVDDEDVPDLDSERDHDEVDGEIVEEEPKTNSSMWDD